MNGGGFLLQKYDIVLCEFLAESPPCNSALAPEDLPALQALL